MKELILLLVILNPFAQILYLSDLIDHLSPMDFIKVHFKASGISFIMFIIFAFIGEKYLMKHIFQVRLASLQIFGGIIMLFIAFQYIIKGPGSNTLFKGDISDLAPNISLPYMVGPGTIWLSILIGRKYSIPETLSIIGCVIAINFIFVIGYQYFQHCLSGNSETRVGKYLSILMRTNALFIGAVAVEMLVTGVESIIMT